MSADAPFHLAFPVHDLDAVEAFYGGVLGCAVGRRSARWIDFNFFGNQITAHLKPDVCGRAVTNPVDGDAVPVRHFGAVLEWQAWQAFAAKLVQAGQEFIIRPHVRFESKPGEQGTFFLLDPSGNALEFKGFRDMDKLFEPGAPDDHA